MSVEVAEQGPEPNATWTDQVPATFVVPARQYVLSIDGALGDSLCVSAYYSQRTLASKNYNLVKDRFNIGTKRFQFFHMRVSSNSSPTCRFFWYNLKGFLNLEWL